MGWAKRALNGGSMPQLPVNSLGNSVSCSVEVGAACDRSSRLPARPTLTSCLEPSQSTNSSSRDARADACDLAPILEAAQIPPDTAKRAIAWLVAQRLVLAANDLRCPHQRFSAEVFDPILTDQDKTGREQIAAMMGNALADPAMSLTGLHSLLTQFRMSRRNIVWTPLIRRELLDPFLTGAGTRNLLPTSLRPASALREIDSYIDDYFKHPTKAQIETVARWFSTPDARGANISGWGFHQRHLPQSALRSRDHPRLKS